MIFTTQYCCNFWNISRLIKLSKAITLFKLINLIFMIPSVIQLLFELRILIKYSKFFPDQTNFLFKKKLKLLIIVINETICRKLNLSRFATDWGKH